MPLTFDKTLRLTKWPNIAPKSARRGTVESLLLSNWSSWHHAAAATQWTELSCTFGDSGTRGCSASDVVGLRHMRLLGSGLHRLHRKGRPTGGRPPLTIAPDHCGRWAFRSFYCCWRQWWSRCRQEQQQQPSAPDTQNRDPAEKIWTIRNWTSHDCSSAPGSLLRRKQPLRMTIWWIRLSHLAAALPSPTLEIQPMEHWRWKLAVLVCACWSLVVLSLFLGCWLFCLSWFLFGVGSFVLWLFLWFFWFTVCCWLIHSQASLFSILVSQFVRILVSSLVNHFVSNMVSHFWIFVC